MTDKMFQASLCRIADFDEPFETQALPRSQWGAGDYVIGRLDVSRGAISKIELPNGRLVQGAQDDLMIGALGVRHATLEVVGSWEHVGDDGHMDVMTPAGLLGRATSVSGMLPPLMGFEYRGHAMRNAIPLRMRDFARRPDERRKYDVPTILIVGTSMSAGKTTAARVIVRQLKRLGHRVVGAKLTGAARYRDVLTMGDAGADAIFDFVDVGLPSSVLDASEYRERLRDLLGLIMDESPDVVVAEAGASPLEPYNGDTAMDELRESVDMSVLCASDPYAVVGVTRGFGFEPDLVAGLATSTSAGVEVVEKLSGARAMNILDPDSMPALRDMLQAAVTPIPSS